MAAPSFDEPRPVIAVSACLLGAPVRFDGGHRHSAWIARDLARFADLVPICPEFAAGFGSPREPLRLVVRAGGVRVVMIRTASDLTERLAESARAIMTSLPALDGAILQKGSPSCGPERVRVYRDNGKPAFSHTGTFAQALRQAHPKLPVADDGRLCDPGQRANFLTRIYARARWRTRSESPAAFHARHKFLLYAQSPLHYRLAGRAAAEGRDDYAAALWDGLAVEPTPGKRVNVFQHLLGFFRGRIPKEETHMLATAVEEYRSGWLPFAAPLSLFEYVVARLQIDYLREQYLFRPYPRELAPGGYA